MADIKRSPLAARLGPAFGAAYVEAYKEIAGQEVEAPGGGGLPGGINNGIAHLKRINFGEFQTGKHKGKPYFQAFGTVHLPKQHNGIPVFGKQTKTQPEAMCNTTDLNEKRTQGDNLRRTEKEHLDWILRLLKLLSKQEDPPEPKPGQPWQKWIEAFENYCYDLCKRSIFFSFRTWQPKPQELLQERAGWFVVQGNTRFGPFGTEELAKKKFPNVGQEQQVKEMWEQGVDFTPEGHQEDDQTALGNGQMTVVDDDTQPSGNGEAVPETLDMDDLDALTEAAPTNQEARLRLTEMALEAGYTQEEVTNSDSWEQVKGWIEAPREAEEQVTETEPEPVYIPQKGQQCQIKVSRNGKDTTVDCTITAVDEAKKTVDLRNTATKALYKGIAWDKLFQEGQES